MLQLRGNVKSEGYSIAGHLIQNPHFLIQKKFGIFYVERARLRRGK
jgi:hypothetical protein